MKKILFTGGSGRFAKVFKKFEHNYQIKLTILPKNLTLRN